MLYYNEWGYLPLDLFNSIEHIYIFLRAARSRGGTGATLSDLEFAQLVSNRKVESSQDEGALVPRTSAHQVYAAASTRVRGVKNKCSTFI